ncbi:MAG TPA: ester cyclase [Armatimonadaceae bacterium]|jgi:steroid delta-isomerase-like uncharacterized protein|nr:ester cyclase [Armatimonadaceae bacterium]
MPTPEEAKNVIRTLFGPVLTENKVEMIDELYAEDYEFDAPALSANSGPAQSGREAFKARVAAFRTAFPDAHYTVQDIVSDGTIVCTRMEFGGTHAAPFAGFAATGRDAKITGIHYARLNEQGKIKKTWAGFTNIAEALAPDAK